MESTGTDKHKQKQLQEAKAAEFFTKLYLILQYLHKNGHPCSISLQHYLENVHKIMKSCPNCNIATNAESVCYKYLARINQELNEFTVPIQTSLLIMMINLCKVNVFGSM